MMATLCSSANANAAPADACSVLPATELNAVLGQQFGQPAKSPMPAAVANGVAADAETNLAQLSRLFHPTKTLPGIADTVYLDASYAIHARQGRARYYINIAPIGTYTPATEKRLTDLAAYVAARVK